jgi:hypothetical protein
MTYSRVNYRASLRAGRDRRGGRPEMSTAVDARIPHVPLAVRSPLLAAIFDRQLFWQSSPICARLYGNVTDTVVVAIADGDYTYISMRKEYDGAY